MDKMGKIITPISWSCRRNDVIDRIGQVVDIGVLPRLVELMTSSELNVLVNVPGAICPWMGLQMRVCKSDSV